VIFPARFLTMTDKAGLGRLAFHDWRYDRTGAEKPDFPLNQAVRRGARVLLAGDNFGCGSSREQAVWALQACGIGVIIAPGFGEIFRQNCFRNGLLPITLDPAPLALLQRVAAVAPLTVDLAQGLITAAGAEAVPFRIEAWRREALLAGWDEIDIILRQQEGAIAAFEAARRQRLPWLG
jgi:3-isopropylmalate dehydratase small subunit